MLNPLVAALFFVVLFPGLVLFLPHLLGGLR
jgi:hypothetical protein